MCIREYLYDCDIAIVESYIQTRKKQHSFKGECYCKWALDEILKRIFEESQKLPYHISGMEPESTIDIIREFIEEMDYYSEIASTEEVIYFVFMAKDEAELLLQRFERSQRE